MTVLLTEILLIIISCILATLIHETGHYAVACYLNLKPDLFKLGVSNIVIFKRGILEITALPSSGKIYFAYNRLANAPIKTQKLIALGGPAANLIIGLLSLPIFPMFATLNLIAAAGNLIPFCFREQRTDGAYIFFK